MVDWADTLSHRIYIRVDKHGYIVNEKQLRKDVEKIIQLYKDNDKDNDNEDDDER